MGQAAQWTTAGNAVHYERRRPEESVLSVSLPLLLCHFIDDPNVCAGKYFLFAFEVAIQRHLIHVHARGDRFDRRVASATLND